MLMKNETGHKEKKKKEGRVARIYRLYKSGLKPKQIAEKTKLSERIVRSYVWRAKNPEKYKALLQRYFAKKRQKKENEAIKAAVKNQNQNSKKKGKEAGVTAEKNPVEDG
jgi:hypothetical protein